MYYRQIISANLVFFFLLLFLCQWILNWLQLYRMFLHSIKKSGKKETAAAATLIEPKVSLDDKEGKKWHLKQWERECYYAVADFHQWQINWNEYFIDKKSTKINWANWDQFFIVFYWTLFFIENEIIKFIANDEYQKVN